MTVNCINPGHPVSQIMQDGDMEMPLKLLAILTWKLGGRVEVTQEDVSGFMADADKFLVTHFHNQSIELKMVTLAEGEAIARDAGGMPS